MSINLKQPKYILPLAVLPFLCLFFYVYQSSAANEKKEIKPVAGMNSSVGEVAASVKKKSLADKLDAYRNTYKEADGNTAVTAIIPDEKKGPTFDNSYSEKQRRTLDSISQLMKRRLPVAPSKPQDNALANALNNLRNRQAPAPPTPRQKEKDPMDLFKTQMAYMDSVNKSNDPTFKSEKQKWDKEASSKEAAQKADAKILNVVKTAPTDADFNTLKPTDDNSFMTAEVDENVAGYADSRIRLKLLADITAGKTLVPKGTYVYALINGFSGQRVNLLVKSILFNGKILPVKLEVYDQDGLPGMYVPDSKFREFTKDLGTNSIQGVNMQNGSASGSQFLMSAADKLFSSTSTAIASAIRKNKAKIKYNSYIYLIDTK
jgi:conjugative transposon TraM protein